MLSSCIHLGGKQLVKSAVIHHQYGFTHGGPCWDVCEDIWFIYKRRVDGCYLSYCGKMCDVQFHLDLIVDLWGDIIKLQNIKKLTILWSLNILPVSVILKIKSPLSFSLRLGFLGETEINIFCGRWIANYQSDVKHAIVSLTIISRDNISKGYTLYKHKYCKRQVDLI